MEHSGQPLDGPRYLGFYINELNTLSTVAAGTKVHKNRKGSFIVTGGASIIGGQMLTNLAKGHTSDKLAQDIDGLANNMIGNMQASIQQMKTAEDKALKSKIFRELVTLQRTFNFAEGNEKHGLRGMVTTCADPQIKPRFLASIERMNHEVNGAIHEAISEMQKAGLEEGVQLHAANELPYCPEEHFTDSEWEKTIINSHDLRKECISMEKYLKYAVSLKFNRAMNLLDSATTSVKSILDDDVQPKWSWWNKIFTLTPTPHQVRMGLIPPSLYLGAIPLTKSVVGKSFDNHLEEFKKEGIRAVLSLVEVFENNSAGIITSPITPKEFEQADMMQFQVPTPDFESIPLELIQRGVEFIHWNLSNGRSVYVHCKASRGRSALVEACYLVKHQNMTAIQAYALIQQNRPQAGFEHAKMETFTEFERLCLLEKAAARHPPQEAEASPSSWAAHSEKEIKE